MAASPPQAKFSYPGIKQILSAQMTHIRGTTPSVCMVRLQPQRELPNITGNIKFTFKSSVVQLYDCKVDQGSIQRNESGLIVSLRILDRRWKWKFGTVHGKYNVRLPNGKLDVTTEKKPQELAIILLKRMGERGYDVSSIPNDLRPVCDWKYANPAEEFAKLVDQLGCSFSIDLRNRVMVHKLGSGKALPNYKRLDGGYSLDAPEKPDSLFFIGGPTAYQFYFWMEAIGEDEDGKDRPINDLSYKPDDGWTREIPTVFAGVKGDTDLQREENRKLALKTIYRRYRIKCVYKHGDHERKNFEVPGLDDFKPKKIKQFLPLKSVLVERQPGTRRRPIDEDDPIEYKKPFIRGVFWPENSVYRNTSIGNIYDGSFSFDPEKGVIEFIKPVYKITRITETVDVPVPYQGYLGTNQQVVSRYLYDPADLLLMAACSITENDSRQPVMWTKETPLARPSTPAIFRKRIERPEVYQTVIAKYNGIEDFETNANGEEERVIIGFNVDRIIKNTREIEQKADYYIKATERQYKDTNAYEAEYDGLMAIDLDGLTMQIAWSITGEGVRTRVSQNTEFDFDIPSYEDRRIKERIKNEYST